ncbi:MAG: hypothetical protein QXO00_02415 [Candidatus Bathyarchaeia archaeon]
MVEVKIKIKGRSTEDTYGRKLAMAIDSELPRYYGFWNDYPELLVKDPATGADIIIDPSGFETPELTFNLDYGTHTLEASPTTGYYWDFEVFINGVSQGVKRVNCNNPYKTFFTLEKPPPTLAETISSMMGTMVGLMMLVMVVSIMSSVMKAMKKAR